MGTLDRKTFYRQMMVLAIPIAAQNMLSSCASLVDTAMVVNLGNVATSAVGVAGRWTFFINILLFALCSGSAVLVSQYWGARDYEQIDRTYGVAMTFALALGVIYNVCALLFPWGMLRVFTAETAVLEAGRAYLPIASLGTIPTTYAMVTCGVRRATEDVRVPLVVSTVAVLTNMALNYCLIYGHFGFPALGLKGAAIATAISGWVQLLVTVIFGAVQKHFTFVGPKKLFSFSREFVSKYIRIAIPVLFNEGLWCVGYNAFAAVYARQGSENYAAYTMFNSVEELVFVFFIGLCSACAIMTGKAIGEGDPEGGYQIAKKYMILTPLMGVLTGALLIAIRWPVLGLLNIETQYTADMAAALLLGFACWMPMHNVAYIGVVGVFRAGGDTRIGVLIDSVGTLLWGVPWCFLLGFVFKVPFFWMVIGTVIADDMLKIPFCIYYFRTKLWIRCLVSGAPPEKVSESCQD